MLSDDEFRMLLKHYDRPWSGYRKVRKGVKKRLRRHMNKLGCTSFDTYIQALKDRPELKAECEQCLLVTISRFWRDRGLWEFLQQHLLPEIESSFGSPIRAWSAGCACGEEPYSLAMVWAKLFDTTTLSVLATDSQATCLDRASTGIYASGSLKELPEDYRARFFAPHRGKRQWRILTSKLPPIAWRQHHLFDAPPGSFHLIFLRNSLLTYHQGHRLHAVLSSIPSALIPRGWLVVGSHETLPSTFSNLVRNPSCPWVYQLTP